MAFFYKFLSAADYSRMSLAYSYKTNTHLTNNKYCTLMGETSWGETSMVRIVQGMGETSWCETSRGEPSKGRNVLGRNVYTVGETSRVRNVQWAKRL